MNKVDMELVLKGYPPRIWWVIWFIIWMPIGLFLGLILNLGVIGLILTTIGFDILINIVTKGSFYYVEYTRNSDS